MQLTPSARCIKVSLSMDFGMPTMLTDNRRLRAAWYNKLPANWVPSPPTKNNKLMPHDWNVIIWQRTQKIDCIFKRGGNFHYPKESMYNVEDIHLPIHLRVLGYKTRNTPLPDLSFDKSPTNGNFQLSHLHSLSRWKKKVRDLWWLHFFQIQWYFQGPPIMGPLYGHFPNYSYIFRDSYGSGMGKSHWQIRDFLWISMDVCSFDLHAQWSIPLSKSSGVWASRLSAFFCPPDWIDFGISKRRGWP